MRRKLRKLRSLQQLQWLQQMRDNSQTGKQRPRQDTTIDPFSENNPAKHHFNALRVLTCFEAHTDERRGRKYSNCKGFCLF